MIFFRAEILGGLLMVKAKDGKKNMLSKNFLK